MVIRTSDGFALHIEPRIGTAALESHVLLIDYGIRRIPLVASSELSLPAAEVERRIRSLRQLYATIVLIQAGKAREIPKEAEFDESFDIEARLLGPEEHLGFESVGTGSFWVGLYSATQSGLRAIALIYSFFDKEVRQQLLRRLRAKTESEELDVRRKRFDLYMHETLTWIELQQKVARIKDESTRRRVITVIDRSLTQLGLEPPNTSD